MASSLADAKAFSSSLLDQMREKRVPQLIRNKLNKIDRTLPTEQDFDNLNRAKTRLELVLLSLVVFGIEICYAAETAFVSPILQKIGVPLQLMSMVWSLSPILGFFMCPILGSLSDGCQSSIGRRRPFIIIYSIGILIGLILLGYGHIISELDDDEDDNKPRGNLNQLLIFLTILGVVLLDFNCDACQSPARAYLLDVSSTSDHSTGLSTFTAMAGAGGCIGYLLGAVPWSDYFNSSSSPSTSKVDIGNKNLNISVYGMDYYVSDITNDHKQILFTCVAFIYVVCAFVSITSFKEIPLGLIKRKKGKINYERMEEEFDYDEEFEMETTAATNYEDFYEQPKGGYQLDSNHEQLISNELPKETSKSNKLEIMKYYLMSIVHMPNSLRWLCVTHCLSWMSLLCYSLYFTDFVGEEVYGGKPIQTWMANDSSHLIYDSGVRYGSFCMAIYSISCSFYSFFLQYLIKCFRTRNIYRFSQISYSVGMLILALTRNKIVATLASFTAGMIYSSLFTIPFILLANYHSSENFELVTHVSEQSAQEQYNANESTSNRPAKKNTDKRGLGTDLSLVSSMVFVAQFFLSFFIGSLMKLVGSKSVVIYAASFLSLTASFTATKLLYFD